MLLSICFPFTLLNILLKPRAAFHHVLFFRDLKEHNELKTKRPQKNASLTEMVCLRMRPVMGNGAQWSLTV